MSDALQVNVDTIRQTLLNQGTLTNSQATDMIAHALDVLRTTDTPDGGFVTSVLDFFGSGPTPSHETLISELRNVQGLIDEAGNPDAMCAYSDRVKSDYLNALTGLNETLVTEQNYADTLQKVGDAANPLNWVKTAGWVIAIVAAAGIAYYVLKDKK